MHTYSCDIEFKIIRQGERSREIGVFSLFVDDTERDSVVFDDFNLVDLQIIEEDNEELKIVIRFIKPAMPLHMTSDSFYCKFAPEKSSDFIKLVRKFALRLRENTGFFTLRLISKTRMHELLILGYTAEIISRSIYELGRDGEFYLKEKEGYS